MSKNLNTKKEINRRTLNRKNIQSKKNKNKNACNRKMTLKQIDSQFSILQKKISNKKELRRKRGDSVSIQKEFHRYINKIKNEIISEKRNEINKIFKLQQNLSDVLSNIQSEIELLKKENHNSLRRALKEISDKIANITMPTDDLREIYSSLNEKVKDVEKQKFMFQSLEHNQSEMLEHINDQTHLIKNLIQDFNGKVNEINTQAIEQNNDHLKNYELQNSLLKSIEEIKCKIEDKQLQGTEKTYTSIEHIKSEINRLKDNQTLEREILRGKIDDLSKQINLYFQSGLKQELIKLKSGSKISSILVNGERVLIDKLITYNDEMNIAIFLTSNNKLLFMDCNKIQGIEF